MDTIDKELSEGSYVCDDGVMTDDNLQTSAIDTIPVSVTLIDSIIASVAEIREATEINRILGTERGARIATEDQIKGNANSNRISKLSAKTIAIEAAKQRVSRRLLMAKHSESLTCVCDVTGIVSILEVPSIPLLSDNGHSNNNYKVATYVHPISILSNARGMAQAGLSYLRKLDTQVLAGLLIVLADDYELFRYQPADSGAQKNAILRAAGKDVLIDAILFCEDYIHSSNHNFLPKLSLILEPAMREGEISGRMIEWLKLVTKLVYSADFSSDEDEFYASVPVKTMKPQYVKDKEKADKAAEYAKTQAKWAVSREFKEDKKRAKEIIPVLAKSASLTLKLVALIKGVFSEDTLLTMPAEVKNLLCDKLSQFPQPEAAILAAMVRKDRSRLMDDFDSLASELDALDDLPKERRVSGKAAKASAALDDDEGMIAVSGASVTSVEIIESSVVGTMIVETTIESPEETESDPMEAPEGTTPIEVGDYIFYVPAAEWNALGILGKMRYKKELRIKYPQCFVESKEQGGTE